MELRGIELKFVYFPKWALDEMRQYINNMCFNGMQVDYEPIGRRGLYIARIFATNYNGVTPDEAFQTMWAKMSIECQSKMKECYACKENVVKTKLKKDLNKNPFKVLLNKKLGRWDIKKTVDFVLNGVYSNCRNIKFTVRWDDDDFINSVKNAIEINTQGIIWFEEIPGKKKQKFCLIVDLNTNAHMTASQQFCDFWNALELEGQEFLKARIWYVSCL